MIILSKLNYFSLRYISKNKWAEDQSVQNKITMSNNANMMATR